MRRKGNSVRGEARWNERDLGKEKFGRRGEGPAERCMGGSECWALGRRNVSRLDDEMREREGTIEKEGGYLE